ncbi:MAG: ABC transporter ATP-binding protein [Bryobacterales bacterium]|nr:ABC transporter ATP-binding protein [Bryobacterales bacterium]
MRRVLEVERLRFGFDPPSEVLHGVSFAVNEGECLGIVGANGSGKSTLLWCVLGLYHAGGSVKLFGEPLSRKNRHRIGAVFQNPEDQLFMPRLLEDVALPLINRGVPASTAGKQALAALEAAGLGHAAGRPAAKLSLGERKRAAIAAALVTSPELLILDEPTAELDGRSVRRLVELLGGLTVTRLVASHDLEFLRRLGARLLVLRDGAVMAEGPAADILENRALLEEAGLV